MRGRKPLNGLHWTAFDEAPAKAMEAPSDGVDISRAHVRKVTESISLMCSDSSRPGTESELLNVFQNNLLYPVILLRRTREVTAPDVQS